MRRLALKALIAGAALAATTAVGAAPAQTPVARTSEAGAQPEQAVENRAAVVVDTGSGVQYGCVRFTSDTISGREALERAAMDPVFQEFGGNLGGAVCSLCGTGCPVGSCLTCASQVWSYWRQAASSGGYAYSSLGVNNTVVRDGDVEGWVWGRSGPPPGITVENVCGPEVPPPTPPPPAVPAPGSPGADPTATGGAIPGGDGAGAAAGADPAGEDGSSAPGGGDGAATGEGGAGENGEGKAASKKKDDANERNADGDLTAATSDDSGGGGGGPPASLLGLLALLAVLGGAALWFRHVRNRPAPG